MIRARATLRHLTRAAGLAAIAPILLAGCASRPTRVHAHVDAGPTPAHADFDNYGRVLLPVNARVLVIGDDLTGLPKDLPGATFKPQKHRPRPAEPFTVWLAAALGPNVTLISRTTTSARIGDAVRDFASLPHVDAIVAVFGPGDMWGGPKPLPAAQFANSVSDLIGKAKAAAIPVILVTPPPVSDAKLDGAVYAVYRGAAQDRAKGAGESVLTFDAAFRKVPHAWSDGIHLSTAGSHALANYLAGYFVLPAPDQSPR